MIKKLLRILYNWPLAIRKVKPKMAEIEGAIRHQSLSSVRSTDSPAIVGKTYHRVIGPRRVGKIVEAGKPIFS